MPGQIPPQVPGQMSGQTPDPYGIEEGKEKLGKASTWIQLENSERVEELMELYPEDPTELGKEELKDKLREIEAYIATGIVGNVLDADMSWYEKYIEEVKESEDNALREQTGILRDGKIEQIAHAGMLPIGKRYQMVGNWYSKLSESAARRLGEETIEEYAENLEDYQGNLEDILRGGQGMPGGAG